MLFADKIRSLREEKKLPQRKIAAVLAIDIPMYSRIERGERPIKREQIKVLADVLGTDESELLKLWLADQVATVLKDDDELINEVLDIAKDDIEKMVGKQPKIKVLSLFANIGVAEAMLNSIGVKISVANEIDPKRAILYQSIYPETKMICGDITDNNIFKDIITYSKAQKVNTILATPPCQGMSTAGKQVKFDKRNSLFLYIIEAVKLLCPEYFIVENVPGFMNTSIELDGKPKLIPDIIKEEVGKHYNLQFQIINAKDYEIPQMRERMILLATRKDIVKQWRMPKSSSNIVTMMDAIGWIPPIDPFVKDITQEEFNRLFPHYEERKAEAIKISKWNFPTSHVLRNVLAMQYTPTGCTAFDNPIHKPRKKDGSIVRGFKNTYKRQNWDTPAYTIAMDNIEISSQNNVHPGRYIGKNEKGEDMYSDARALTLYELMRLMTIPDSWPLPENTNPAYLRKVIGEGVPSLLMKKIFMEIV